MARTRKKTAAEKARDADLRVEILFSIKHLEGRLALAEESIKTLQSHNVAYRRQIAEKKAESKRLKRTTVDL